MQLQHGKSRWVTRLRAALILLLASAFCAVTVFTDMESIAPARSRVYWSLCPAYTLWEDETVSESKTDLIRQVPGVARVDGFGEMNISLSFEGKEEEIVWLYAIDEDDWTETFDFHGIKEDFHDGELVLLCFPESSEEAFLRPEGQINLRVYDHSGEILAHSQVDAHIVEVPDHALNRALYALWEPYTVFCSENYLKELLSSMEAGQKWDKYIAGTEFGYDRVYVGVDLNSDYLSTDLAMAELCKELGLTFDNRRQEFQARVQENVQTLILLYSSGICIGLVILLILTSALTLEAEQEKQKFRVLRSIGMSKRQMNRRIFTTALARSLTSLLLGWMLYGSYAAAVRLEEHPQFWEALSAAVSSLEYNGCNFQRVLLVSGICLTVPLAITLLAKRNIGKGELAL